MSGKTDLAGGVAHVVDLALRGGRVAKTPVLRLKPLVAPVCQHLAALHAALHTATETVSDAPVGARGSRCAITGTSKHSFIQLPAI